MIELHPEIVNKDGKPESVVLPYAEYVLVQEALQHLERALAPSDPRYGGYWENLSAEELARRQDVRPIADLSELAWPFGAEDWDGFEEAMDQMRNADPIR